MGQVALTTSWMGRAAAHMTPGSSGPTNALWFTVGLRLLGKGSQVALGSPGGAGGTSESPEARQALHTSLLPTFHQLSQCLGAGDTLHLQR